MIAEARELTRALVGAYRPHVVERVEAMGVVWDPGCEAAAQAGQRWLGEKLAELLDMAFDRQRRGPLELFQEAMRFPTGALEDAGVTPPRRDPVAAAALPGDTYDLAPASSRDLGEEVWRCHLAWGAAKVRGLVDPGSRSS
jgi:hypothetical protein